MGNKSNLITLRKNLQNLSFQTLNLKQFFYLYNFIKYLEHILLKKGILLTDYTINIINNKLYLNLYFFFRTFKSIQFKRKLKKIKTKTTNNKKALKILFSKTTKILKLNKIVLNAKNLNLKLKKKQTALFYKDNNKYLKNLFDRKLNLFIDFLKISNLLAQKEIHAKSYLLILVEIFKYLSKKKHSKFISFVKENFALLKKLSPNIAGIKLVLNGKIKGKTRASNSIIIVGSISTQTIDKEILTAYDYAETRYGTFGFTMSISY